MIYVAHDGDNGWLFGKQTLIRLTNINSINYADHLYFFFSKRILFGIYHLFFKFRLRAPQSPSNNIQRRSFLNLNIFCCFISKRRGYKIFVGVFKS